MNAAPLFRRLARKINHYLNKIDRRFKPLRVLAQPVHLQIESLNRCNLRCVMCPIEELTAIRRRRALTAESFETLLKHFPYLELIWLQGIGEPLANREIFDVIRVGAREGIAMELISNGTLLTDEACHNLCEAGLTRILVSVDSATADVFESIRLGAKFDVVMDNLRRFVGVKRALRAASPALGTVTVVMDRNFNEIPEIIDYLAHTGVDCIIIKGLNTWVNGNLAAVQDETQLGRIRETAKRVEADNKVSVILFFDKPDPTKLRCRWPWNGTYITAEGDVTPCCNCPDSRDINLGNINEQPFAEIWNGERYRAFRKALRGGVPKVCATCPDY